MYSSRLLLVVLCIGFMAASVSSAGIVHTYVLGDHWTASEDWTGNGVVAKDPDSYGTADVWLYESVAPGNYDPASRSLLTTFALGRWANGSGDYTGKWCYVSSSGMHPDHWSPARDPVRTWVSPINGKVRIEGTMSFNQPPHTTHDGVVGYIHLGAMQLWSKSLTPSATGDSEDFLLEDVEVSIGDKIAFRLNPNGERWSDGTTFNPTITYVPEPITISLLSVGGLLLLRRRRA